MTTTAAETNTTPAESAGALATLVAGYIGHRTTTLGLHHGLFDALHDRGSATPDELADVLSLNAFYTAVWARAAFAAGVLERDRGGYRLAAHVDTLLLDADAPVYMGATFPIFEEPDVFDRFDEAWPTGGRTWWDQCSHDFIHLIAATGRPFYTRLIPTGLEQVPGLADRLARPAAILDAACGSGAGLVRLAQTYPHATVAGADGDAYSLQVAAERLEQAGLGGRVEFIHTPLEELDRADEFDLVINNISMHECRDLDRVTANIRHALKPDGWFVISDFAFPETDEELRTVPGRMMTGIQFFEALIDDQLLPPSVYTDLLSRHGFQKIGTCQLGIPTHVAVHGRRARPDTTPSQTDPAR